MALSDSLKEELKTYFKENGPTKLRELNSEIDMIRQEALREKKNNKYPSGQFIIGRDISYREIPRPAAYKGYWYKYDYNNPIYTVTDLIYIKEEKSYSESLLYRIDTKEYQNGFFISAETGDLSNHRIHYNNIYMPNFGSRVRKCLIYNNLKSFVTSANNLKIDKEIINKYIILYTTQYGPKNIRIV